MINLEIIQLFQKFNHPAFFSFVKFLRHFDTQEFLFILVPIVWIFFGRRIGLKILFILVINGLINQITKNILEMPRPFHIDPIVGIIYVRGYGFPSGAAQTSMLLGSILIYSWKSRLKWIIAPLYILAIAFSRMYLGVHFLEDILGGWAIALLVLTLYIYAFPKIEQYLARHSLFQTTAISLLVITPFLFLTDKDPIVRMLAASLGAILGFYFTCVLKIDPSKHKTIIKCLLIVPLYIVSAFFISFGILNLPLLNLKIKILLQSGLLGFWLTFLAPYIADKLPKSFGEKLEINAQQCNEKS